MIVWLASYPKSGNTWVRTIISSLLFSSNGKFDMELLKNIPQFPRQDHFKGLTDDYSDLNKVFKYWIKAQERINLENKIWFYKTHNANIKIGNYSFTNRENTLATIYIVRDPRNLVSSIANHFNLTNEQAKNFMIEKKALKENIGGESGVITPITDWEDHYISWCRHNNNLLIIRYEDLINNTKKEIFRICEFLGKLTKIDFDDNKIEKIIETTNFKELQKLEANGGFKEYKDTKEKFNFFYKGPENNWGKDIDINIINQIEMKFKKTMKQLRYL